MSKLDHQSEILIDTLFRNALSRRPSEKEKASAIEIIGETNNANGVGDLLWILAMHPEFQLIQ